MLYLLLVFAHLLAASMALGAIVATDLRLLSKLAEQRARIAPPNAFVMRMISVALLLLYITGAGIVAIGMRSRADYLDNPKLLAKLVLVVLLTVNAFVLHRLTFPRLTRGRSVTRWRIADWLVVGIPVAASNSLWLFVAFLGIARPWNYSMPMRVLLEIAMSVYAVTQVVVFAILACAARPAAAKRWDWVDLLARILASVGALGVSKPPRPDRGTRDVDPATLPYGQRGAPPLRLVATPWTSEVATDHGSRGAQQRGAKL